MKWRQVLTFPTWVIVMAMWSFLPEEHPWKIGRRWTLWEWSAYSSPLADAFAIFFWGTTPIFLVVVLFVIPSVWK